MAAECRNAQGSVYLLRGHDQTQLPRVLEAVKKLPCVQNLPHGEEVVYLGQRDQRDAAVPVRSPSQLLVELYRRHKPAGTTCKTVLSAESQLVVVQLCLAEYSKQKYDIYDTDASEVLHASRELTEHKLSRRHANSSAEESDDSRHSPGISESSSQSQSVRKLYEAFLSSCNMVDVGDVYRQVKSLSEKAEETSAPFRTKRTLVVLQWPSETLERKILELFCAQAAVTEIIVERLPASSESCGEEDIELCIQERDWETIIQDISTGEQHFLLSPRTPRLPASATEVLVHHVFLAFLGLLVNSRDEIALARCLSYSPTGLDHKGFTALKNIAKMKNMSMYQTAVSYIMRLRLGAQRSNAPSTETSSLSDHVKSLSEFVTNVQKLQILVEEVPDARQSITKVLLSIKAILCKCRDSVFKQAAVERVCAKLTSKFDILLTAFDRKNEASPPKAVNQGGSVLGRKTLKVILAFLDEEAASPAPHNAIRVLSDCTLTQTTPIRMPSLLARFRSPEVVDPDSPENKSLRDRVIAPTEEVKQPKLFSYKSDMAWAEPTHRNPLQEQNPNIDRSASSQTANQPIKLWAETPPEKHRHARVFPHAFESPVGSPPCRQPGGPRPSRGEIDHTPKRPKGRVGKMTDAALDKENLPGNHGEGGEEKGAGSKKKGAEVKRRVKRVLMEDAGSAPPCKKAKKGVAGSRKKKQVALVKGQKTLNQFFRL